MFLEAVGGGFGVADWVFGAPGPVQRLDDIEVKGVSGFQKGRKVNQDPYGGDAVIWDDVEFFNRTPENDLTPDDHGGDGIEGSDTDDFLYMQSNAVQRLAQVRRHLADVAMTRQQEEFRIAESLQFQQQPLPWDWWRDTPAFKNQSIDIVSQQEQARPYLATVTSLPTQKMVNPERCADTSFHCSRADCLFNLELENRSLPISDQPAACIHSGCEHCSATLDEWLAHALSLHHDEDPKLS